MSTYIYAQTYVHTHNTHFPAKHEWLLVVGSITDMTLPLDMHWLCHTAAQGTGRRTGRGTGRSTGRGTGRGTGKAARQSSIHLARLISWDCIRFAQCSICYAVP